MHHRIAAKAATPGARLRLGYSISLLKPEASELRPDGAGHFLPGVGSRDARREGLNRITVECFKAGPQPALVSAEIPGFPEGHTSTTWPNYSPSGVNALYGAHYWLHVHHPEAPHRSPHTHFVHCARSLHAADPCGGGPRRTGKKLSRPEGRIPHKVTRVTVDDDVELEVLDWCGRVDSALHPTLALLAGLGGTAHTFNNFAPKLATDFHVLGITRRGLGAFSAPDEGYELDHLADDIVEVLEARDLRSVILVGDSIAGEGDDERGRATVLERSGELPYTTVWCYK